MLYVLALLIGVIAGLRAMTAPAAVGWGAYLGWLPVAGTWAGFMSHWAAVGIFTILAIVELVTDQLPSTPSRKVPQQFGARIIMGAFTIVPAIKMTTDGNYLVGKFSALQFTDHIMSDSIGKKMSACFQAHPDLPLTKRIV